MAVFSATELHKPFRDVRAWYSRLAVLDRQICRIESLDGRPLGTGFLVAGDLVLTAQHVITQGRQEPQRDFLVRFDYLASPLTGEVAEGRVVSVAEGPWLLGHSPPFGEPPTESVDTALFRLAEPMGAHPGDGAGVRGWVDLNDGVSEPPIGSSLAIMQHPEGGPLKLSLNTEAVLGFDGLTGRLMHRTDTQPGSSGAPCFDFDWQFVALHEGRDVRGGNHNFGIPFRMIRRWLEQRDLWRHVAARSPVTTPLVRFGAGSESPAMAQFAMPANLKALVQQDEGQLVEFKREIAIKNGKLDASKVSISVAAFLNSREGGNVMIGIADDRTVVGIEKEYEKLNDPRKNWDGYERSLHSSLIDRLDGASHFSSFTVTRYQEQGRDVCAIHVQPSDRPVFVDDQLYVRRGAQNRPVKGREIIDFVAARWSLLGNQAKPSEPEVELEAVPHPRATR